ncbi:MAG: hypothetical protein MI741_08845, partial [Rhodospirillales bacterium]|nr:hypothetical protein [Rhodospirillales bacterium]
KLLKEQNELLRAIVERPTAERRQEVDRLEKTRLKTYRVEGVVGKKRAAVNVTAESQAQAANLAYEKHGMVKQTKVERISDS